MWVAFALQKLLTYLQQNINVSKNTLAMTFNKFVIIELNKLMMLWTTGPWWYVYVKVLAKWQAVKNLIKLLLQVQFGLRLQFV